MIDLSFSGTTSVSVVVRGDFLLTANLGDSRAVLGSYANGGWILRDLTID
jgi:serine/threonine protein phosphatase PrpC